MPSLMIRMSIADILLTERLIDKHMKENNIKNIDDVDEKVIQQQYNEIMEKQMWENPHETTRVLNIDGIDVKISSD